jgi:hypothetical protein
MGAVMNFGIETSRGLGKGTLAVFGAGLALSLSLMTGCAAPIVVTPQHDLLVGEQIFQRMPGSVSKIFLESKRVLSILGFKIVSVRGKTFINAKLDSPKRPIVANLKILGDGSLSIRLYNLKGAEHDEWLERLYTGISDSLEGIPVKRQNGWSRQG